MNRLISPGEAIRRRPAEALCLVLLVAPLLVFALQEMVGTPIRPVPVADNAVLELELTQVPGHWPLLGAYSRYEFHHPGPAGDYLILPWYLLGGRHSAAVSVGAVAVNLLCVVVTLLLMRPWSTTGLLAGLVVALLTMRYLGSPLLTTSWGPYFSVAPLAAFFALSARFNRGDPGSWVLAALLGGVLIQLHVLYVPTCALMLGVAVLLPAGPGVSLKRRWLWALGAVTVLLWLPVLIDLSRGTNSNAMDLLRFFRASFVPADTALRFILGAQAVTALPLTVAGALPGPFPDLAHAAWQPATPAAIWTAFILQAVLAGGLLLQLARDRSSRTAFRLTALVVVVLVWGVFSVLRIRGPVMPYILAWLTIPTAILWTLGLAQGLRLLRTRPQVRLPLLVGGLVVAGLLLANVLRDDRAFRRRPPDPRVRTITALTTDLLAGLPELKTEGVHIARADADLWGIVTGLTLQLHKAGVAVTTGYDFSLMMPDAYLDALPDKPALWLTRDPTVGAGLPLVAEYGGVRVRRLWLDGSGETPLAYAEGWSPAEDWGRWLREREGRLVARRSGPATLVVEVSLAPEMTSGQDLTVFENDREVWAGHIETAPWQWTTLEIPLASDVAAGRRDIRFRCGRDYHLPNGRVRPFSLATRHLDIVAGGEGP